MNTMHILLHYLLSFYLLDVSDAVDFVNLLTTL